VTDVSGFERFVGRIAEREVIVSDGLVRAFADLVGDHNPLHLDATAAAGSRFGRPIAHGMLIGSLFSGLIATELPGPGSIYLGQSLAFRRPVFVGDRVTARVTCISADASRGRLSLETLVFDATGDVCVRGEADVLVD
jgi:enoyl-CoA hydratase